MVKILTVDDSTTMRDMLRVALEDRGFEVIQAEDGVTGIEAAKKTGCDLVITDLNMPNMNGFEFVKQLRALDEYKDKPILFLTTEAAAEKKVIGKESGATGWIVKPFNPDHLVMLLNKVLGTGD